MSTVTRTNALGKLAGRKKSWFPMMRTNKLVSKAALDNAVIIKDDQGRALLDRPFKKLRIK